MSEDSSDDVADDVKEALANKLSILSKIRVTVNRRIQRGWSNSCMPKFRLPYQKIACLKFSGTAELFEEHWPNCPQINLGFLCSLRKC